MTSSRLTSGVAGHGSQTCRHGLPIAPITVITSLAIYMTEQCEAQSTSYDHFLMTPFRPLPDCRTTIRIMGLDCFVAGVIRKVGSEGLEDPPFLDQIYINCLFKVLQRRTEWDRVEDRLCQTHLPNKIN